MALEYGLFDSTEVVRNAAGFPVGNKAKTADFFARYFSTFIGNGIVKKVDGFQVRASSGFKIRIMIGEAFIKGYYCYDDKGSMLTVSVDTSRDQEVPVVLRLDLNQGAFSVLAETGGASVPVRTNRIYDLVLGIIRIPAGSEKIEDSMIEDTRGDETLCGYVKSLSHSDAEKLANAIQLSLTGGCQGEVSFDGSEDASLEVESIDVGYVNRGVLPVSFGGTGATTAAAACTNLGAAPKNHQTSPSDLTAGRLPSGVLAASGTDTNCRLRNLAIRETLPTSMSNGEICLVYGASGRGLYVFMNGAAVLIASPNT